MSDAMIVAFVVALLLLAALLSLSESAITSISRVKAHHLADQRLRGSEPLLKIVLEPAPFMTVLLLLKVLALVTTTVLAAGLAIDNFETLGEAIAIGAMTLAVFVVAEVGPKTFAIQRTERIALFVAGSVFVIGRVLNPMGRLLILVANAVISPLPGRTLPKGPFVTESEIRHMADVAEEEEEIEEGERELIHSVFEFGDTVVREVMVPRPDMVTCRWEATLDDALETILVAGYSRIPIYEGDHDNIVGVLYAKDVLKRIHESKGSTKVTSLGRVPLFVPEQKKVAELLREMQQRRVHMAIVIDEYGGTAGLVTIEDLIEEIVGEIIDEYDQEEPLVEPLDESTIRVDAKMPIDEINELLNVELPHEEWDTVGGLVFGLAGRVPEKGEIVRLDSLEFRTERVTGRRIQKVVITKLSSSSPEDEG
ncbi:MAG: hemolysin family protein [Actinomycetota bacterium]